MKNSHCIPLTQYTQHYLSINLFIDMHMQAGRGQRSTCCIPALLLQCGHWGQTQGIIQAGHQVAFPAELPYQCYEQGLRLNSIFVPR